MAWETRGNQRYYYRAYKVNGRVHKVYLGSGPSADIAAQRDARIRDRRHGMKEQRRQDHEAILALETPVDGFADILETLTRATLVSAGYHRHHGSEWRKRRHA